MASPPCFSCPGSETHTAAGEAQHSLQRNGQVSDTALQRGAGRRSYTGLVVLQLPSHPIRPRFTPCVSRNRLDFQSRRKGKGRWPQQAQNNLSELSILKILEDTHQNLISLRRFSQPDTVSWLWNLCHQLFKLCVTNTKRNKIHPRSYLQRQVTAHWMVGLFSQLSEGNLHNARP